MIIFIAIVFLVFGAAIGSFLNVLIDRLPSGRKIFVDRSVCDSCHKKLEERDLIPIFSYLALKGKCRFCHAKIPQRILYVELITATVFVISSIFYYSAAMSLSQIIYFLAISCSFIVIFFTDIDYGIIPDQLVLFSGAISLLYSIFFERQNLPNNLLAGLGAGVFFLVLYFITKGKGMGFGDVKLALILGFFLGFPKIVLSIYLAFLTGALVAIILVIWGKKRLRGGTIPFGPFLVSSGIVSYVWGDQIIQKILQVLIH